MRLIIFIVSACLCVSALITVLCGGLPPAQAAPTTPPPDAAAPAAARDLARKLVHELARASQGLLCTSEADFPFTVVAWRRPGPRPSAGRVAALTGHHPGELLDQRALEDFFASATTPRPWHSPAERESVQRTRRLLALLHARLRDLRVYRFGRLNIDAYIIGVAPDGDWVGLATKQVET
jgi:hypothetical protein